jgi:hypothetical protein
MKIGANDITSCKIGNTQINEVRIGSTLVWQFASIDPDAQAFLTAAGITDTTISEATNTFVLGCKSNNVWSDIDVILPTVGGSASSHRVCLKTATNKVTWNGGITHNSTGVLFNGINGYGEVDWNAPNLYNRTAIEWTKDIISGNGWSGIYNTAVFGMQLSKALTNMQTVATGLNNLVAININDSFGLRASVVESSGTNGGKHYGNTGLLNEATPTAAPSGLNYYIGALNLGGSPIINNNRLQQFFVFGSAFNASKIAIIKTLIQDFQNTIGR